MHIYVLTYMSIHEWIQMCMIWTLYVSANSQSVQDGLWTKEQCDEMVVVKEGTSNQVHSVKVLFCVSRNCTWWLETLNWITRINRFTHFGNPSNSSKNIDCIFAFEDLLLPSFGKFWHPHMRNVTLQMCQYLKSNVIASQWALVSKVPALQSEFSQLNVVELDRLQLKMKWMYWF